MINSAYPTIFADFLKDALAHSAVEVRETTALNNERREYAWHLLSYALQNDSLWPETRALLLELAPKMEMAGFRDDWISYLEFGAKQSECVHDRAAQAKLYSWLAHSYELCGEHRNAFELFAKSAAIYESIDNLCQYTKVLSWQVYVARLMRDQDAISTLLNKINVYIDQLTSVDKVDYHLVLGWLAIDREDSLAAIDNFQSALRWTIGDANQRLRYKAMRGLATTYYIQTNYDEAFKYWTEALHLAGEFQDISEQAVLRMNLGVIYLTTNKVDKAIAYFVWAEEIFLRTHDVYNLALVLHNLGIAYRTQFTYANAIVTLERAVSLYQQIEEWTYLTDALNELGVTYLSSKQFIEADSVLQKALSFCEHIRDCAVADLRKSEITANIKQVEWVEKGNSR